MDTKEEIRRQIVGALSGAEFPIDGPEQLLGAFPEGAETRCKAGEVEMTAGEAGELLTGNDFPFGSAEEVADTILARAGL